MGGEYGPWMGPPYTAFLEAAAAASRDICFITLTRGGSVFLPFPPSSTQAQLGRGGWIQMGSRMSLKTINMVEGTWEDRKNSEHVPRCSIEFQLCRGQRSPRRGWSSFRAPVRVHCHPAPRWRCATLSPPCSQGNKPLPLPIGSSLRDPACCEGSVPAAG